MRLHIYPAFAGEDQGDGGVRRVVEAQREWFAKRGVRLVDDPAEAQVIACHISAPASYLQRFPEIPIVAHCHGLYWSEYEWADWAYKANADVLKLVCVADVVTAPTEWVAQVLRRHTSRDVRVIPHGINLNEWRSVPKTHDGYVLWNKNRPDPVCDPTPLNELAKLMPEQRFVTTFGDDAMNVSVIGRQPYERARDTLRRAGVYLATTRETFGIGTIEALAAGIPVVGYRWGGQAEFLEHGVDGWLVEPGDIEGLAEGVRWALENRATISIATRAKAKQFSWEKAADAYLSLYTEAIEKHRQLESAARVDVVVTSYKLGAYLPACLDSVLTQTEPNWHCWIVDDASPDNSGEIARRYAERDKRFSVVNTIRNRYLAGARNLAIELGGMLNSARYVLPLDADDKLDPQAIELLADALDSNRTLDVAYGNVMFFEEDGITPSVYGANQPKGHSGWPMPFDVNKQVQGANLLPYASMYRRRVWELTGGYRERLKTSEDADFWTRAASYGFRIEMVTEHDTLLYRNREGSMSRTQQENRYAYRAWYPWAKMGNTAPAAIGGPKAVSLFDPKITVVIPVGPGHDLLVRDAIDSVAAQSFGGWECVVVNDSGVLLHVPTWVRVINCDARNVSVARNMGVAAARAPLYLPLDADDYLQPDALQWLATAFVEGQGGIVYPDMYEDPKQAGVFTPYGFPDYDCELLVRGGALHAITALTPVEVWRQVGGYAEDITSWEDWDFQLRCAAAGVGSRRIAAPLFTYRKHTGQRARWNDPSEFAARKQDMLQRWGEYMVEGKKLMACGCSARQTATISPLAQRLAQVQEEIQPDATMVQYIGKRGGNVQYRARSGHVYTFARNDPPKWVAREDMYMFGAHQDFRVVAGTAPVLADALAPTLEA